MILDDLFFKFSSARRATFIMNQKPIDCLATLKVADGYCFLRPHRPSQFQSDATWCLASFPYCTQITMRRTLKLTQSPRERDPATKQPKGNLARHQRGVRLGGPSEEHG